MKAEDVKSDWSNPACGLLSQLGDTFVQAMAYAHVTRQESLDIIRFMLSRYSSDTHEQLLDAFIRLGLLEKIPSTVYYRIVNTNLHGVFTPASHCYSSTCDHRQKCYSPICHRQKSEPNLFKSTHTWLERIPQHIIQKTHRHELIRQAAIVDLISMEQSYLADLLVLHEVYAKPLLQSCCISDTYRGSFHRVLFGNYRPISKLHQRFCSAVIQHYQKSNQVLFGRFGHFIQEHIQALVEPYIEYTSNHIRSSYALRIEQHRNPAFCQFINTQNSERRTKRLGIKHFLSAPTLWIGKYRMLVEALVKRTPSSSEDKPILHDCVAMLQDLMARMNRAAAQGGQDARHAQIFASLIPVDTGCHQQVFRSHSKLVYEGKVWLERSALAPLSTMTKVQSHVFLFDHMLFITQARLINGMEEYTLAGKPIPLAAFVWMNEDQYNRYSLAPPLMHRISRQLSSRLSAKSSTIWSTLRKTPSMTFQSSSPAFEGPLCSSKSTPIHTPEEEATTFPASRLRRRLRSNRWSSSPVYTHSSSAILTSSFIPASEHQLNRRQSVPEFSLRSHHSDHVARISTEKNKMINTNTTPLTPIEGNKSRPSSCSSTSSSYSSSEIPTVAVTPPILEPNDSSNRCLQFAHAGSMETPYRFEFGDAHECQLWRDTLSHALSAFRPIYSLSPIWEQSALMFRGSKDLHGNERVSSKRLSVAPWSSISVSASSSTLALASSSHAAAAWKRLDSEEYSNQIHIHCALSYENKTGERMIALGTQDGVWVGLQHHLDDMKMLSNREHHGLVQIIPEKAIHRLAMIDGMLVAMACSPKHKYMLVAYPLMEDSDRTNSVQHQGRPSKDQKKWCIVKRDCVISMVVGRLYQQSVLIYLTLYGEHTLAVVAVRKSQSPWFKKVKEYTVCLKDASSIYLHSNTIYIHSAKHGVESIVPSRKRETSVSWQQVYGSPSIAYLPLSDNHGLAVTSTGVQPVYLPSCSLPSLSSATTPTIESVASLSLFSLLYMDTNGSTTGSSPLAARNNHVEQKRLRLFDFESRISTVSLDYPFLLAFGASSLEIWNVESAELVQVMHSPSVRCLYDSTQCIVNEQASSSHPSILVCPTYTTSPYWDKNSRSIPFRIYQVELHLSSSNNNITGGRA